MAELKTRFQSKNQSWETPIELFNKLNNELHFDFDLAASEDNKKCNNFFSAEQDSLKQEWAGRCWLNPPYGYDNEHKLSNWVIKAYNETLKDNCFVAMLIPARTNTNWWHQYCMKSDEIRFICSRPKFVGASHGLPLPLAILIFDKHPETCKLSSFYI